MKLFEIYRYDDWEHSWGHAGTVAWIWATSKVQAKRKFEKHFDRHIDMMAETIEEREPWELEIPKIPPIIN